MQIRTRLALQFSILMSVIMVLLGLSVYYLSANYRQQEFYQRLKEEAITTVKLFSDVKEVDYKLLKIIDRNVENVLPDEEVLVYDFKNNLLFSTLEVDRDEIPHQILSRVRLEKEIRYKDGKEEVIGLLFE